MGPAQFHNDPDRFVALDANDPLTDWYDQGWWGPVPTGFNGSCIPSAANDWCHCKKLPETRLVGQLPLPSTFSNGGGGNNGVAFLLPDNITVLQLQPVYRCTDGATNSFDGGTLVVAPPPPPPLPPPPLFANRNVFCGNEGEQVCNTSGNGGKVPSLYPRCASIFGDGALGAHGGSGLSVLGGSVRAGEISPSSPPIQHALKLELFAHQYYFGMHNGHRLQNITQGNGGRTQYVWPATSSDNYCCWPHHPLAYNGSFAYLAPGALLAIPTAIAVTVSPLTAPGKKIKQALVDYGAYVVDDTASDSAALIFEPAAEAEFKQLYNLSLETSSGPW